MKTPPAARSRPDPAEDDDDWGEREPTADDLDAKPDDDEEWWSDDDDAERDPRNDVAWLPEDDD
jgi:hypothetical protein